MTQILNFPVRANAKADDGVWAHIVNSMGDDLGPDFSGIRAHAALELHMKECAERRAEDRSDRATMHARLTAMQASIDTRLTEISNRMWGILAGTAGAAVLGLAAIVFYEITARR